MSHVGLLTGIPWEIEWSVAGLRAATCSPEGEASRLDLGLCLGLACTWHGPQCGLSLVGGFNFLTDARLGLSDRSGVEASKLTPRFSQRS